MLNIFRSGCHDFVDYNGEQYYIDTTNTLDCGWETMIFESHRNEVVNWCELYMARYKTEKEAMAGHNYIVKHLELFI